MDPLPLTLLLGLAVLLPFLLSWIGLGFARILPLLTIETRLQQEIQRLRPGRAPSPWRTWRVATVALDVFAELPVGDDRRRLGELLRRFQRSFLVRHLLWLAYLVLVTLQLEEHQALWSVAFGVCFLVFAFVQLPVYFCVRSCLAEISEG